MTQLIRNTDRTGYPNLFDRLFDDLWRDIEPTQKNFRSVEKENEYLLSLDLPGVSKENAHVEVDGGILTIRAERKDFWAGAEGKGESSYKFERSFTLPTSVDVEKIDAQMENGVLNIVLPKLAASKGRKVEIGSGNGFWSKGH